MAATTTPVTPGIRELTELRRTNIDFAGGKGANLGELTSAGLPVPPGFVVGAPAYAAFCDATGLRERLGALLSGVERLLVGGGIDAGREAGEDGDTIGDEGAGHLARARLSPASLALRVPATATDRASSR